MQGQQIDRESGLFYNRHRYYDPQMGRYITQDPIGLRGGNNLYSYVGGSPTNWHDPLGLVPNPAEAACIAGPNPICLAGVAADIGTWIIGGTIVVGGAAVVGNSVSNSTSAATDSTGSAINPNAKPLSDAHNTAAAAGTKSVGYGGNCTPDEHDKLSQKQDQACGIADQLGSCNGLTVSKSVAITKMAANAKCASARTNIMNQCFAGGDAGHRDQAIQKWAAAAKCSAAAATAPLP
jgi:RHS repeat-associated protein